MCRHHSRAPSPRCSPRVSRPCDPQISLVLSPAARQAANLQANRAPYLRVCPPLSRAPPHLSNRHVCPQRSHLDSQVLSQVASPHVILLARPLLSPPLCRARSPRASRHVCPQSSRPLIPVRNPAASLAPSLRASPVPSRARIHPVCLPHNRQISRAISLALSRVASPPASRVPNPAHSRQRNHQACPQHSQHLCPRLGPPLCPPFSLPCSLRPLPRLSLRVSLVSSPANSQVVSRRRSRVQIPAANLLCNHPHSQVSAPASSHPRSHRLDQVGDRAYNRAVFLRPDRVLCPRISPALSRQTNRP